MVRRRAARATACGSSTTSGSGPTAPSSLGRLASYVRDRRIPLEMCPTSNVQTGAAPSIAEHPIGLLRQLSFRVTVNTDNRLMSGVSLSSEFAALSEAFGYGWSDVEWLTINAMKSAFAPFDQRLQIINTVLKPGFAMAKAASDAVLRASQVASGRGHRAGAPGNRGPRMAVRGRRRLTPRSGRCCTGCPALTRSAPRRGPPAWPPGRSRRTPSSGRSTRRSA